MGNNTKLLITFVAGVVVGCLALLFTVFFNKDRAVQSTSIKTEEIVSMMVQRQLTELVQRIEFFKLIKGSYPNDLIELRQFNRQTGMNIDPMSKGSSCIHEYYYLPLTVSNTYYLRSAGADHTIFTSDDILPDIESTDIDKLGLRLEKVEGVEYPRVVCYEMDKA